MTEYLALPDAQRSVERARVATADDLLAPEVGAVLGRQHRAAKRRPHQIRIVRLVDRPQAQLAAFSHQAARLVAALAARLKADVVAGARFEEAWNRNLVEVRRVERQTCAWSQVAATLTRARSLPRTKHKQVYHVSNVHCRLTLVRNFHDGVRALQPTHPALYPALKRLADLFALYWMEQVRCLLWCRDAFTAAPDERVRGQGARVGRRLDAGRFSRGRLLFPGAGRAGAPAGAQPARAGAARRGAARRRVELFGPDAGVGYRPLRRQRLPGPL